MAETAAILLAAGLSRRMGARNKLLLPVDGQPMVRRVAQAYCAVVDAPLTVVTGHEASFVRAALSDLPVTFIHNADYANGQARSVAAGLAAAPDADVLLIGLGDQPQLTATDLRALLKAHRAADPSKITIPMRDGERGNPIVVPRALRPRLTENPERPGCMRFTREHPEHVQAAPVTSPGFFADIDTPEDYAAFSKDHQMARS